MAVFLIASAALVAAAPGALRSENPNAWSFAIVALWFAANLNPHLG